ncbi:hypothetical protein [Pseudomonas sp. FW300-N2A2]|uniref:hypothetical protein n=1 Tax=Pseudomonas sp. FW300-N2A2 TaxID=2751316 RepID=UPI001A917C70|nr:hypothetical protein [Pseudomonas sp. FW300-N2A2]
MSDKETVWCACGDGHEANSYGAGFMAANNGVCENCDAALHPLQKCLHENSELIAAQTTIANQAQMIEHLRGGSTPGFTAIDMGTATADGRRSLYEYLMEKLAVDFPDSETTMTVECFADWMSKEVKP